MFIYCNLFYVGTLLFVGYNIIIDFIVNKSWYIYDTYTNILCQDAGYALGFSYFNNGYNNYLLFYNILYTLYLDNYMTHNDLYKADCWCNIYKCSVTNPSNTNT